MPSARTMASMPRAVRRRRRAGWKVTAARAGGGVGGGFRVFDLQEAAKGLGEGGHTGGPFVGVGVAQQGEAGGGGEFGGEIEGAPHLAGDVVSAGESGFGGGVVVGGGV